MDNELSSASIKVAEKLAKENVWRRNETFYFVNHPTVKTNGFPCMTTRDSMDAGKPCSFPFIYKFANKTTVNYNCSLVDNTKPWCFSKVHPDRTKAREMLKYWGNCNKYCHGESFEPFNIHNLAKEDFNEYWGVRYL